LQAAGSARASGSGLGPGEERTGQGPAIIPLDLTPGQYHTITVSYTGDGMFTAYLVDNDGERIPGALAISYGEYAGTHLVELGRLGEATAVDIQESDGPWSVTLQDLNDAPTWPAQTSGEGETVLRIDQSALSGDTTVVGTHDGESNFIVWAYTEAEFGDRLLFNEIGPYDGDSQEALPSDAIALEIRADGAWTLNQ
jgi:hypothetical protein